MNDRVTILLSRPLMPSDAHAMFQLREIGEKALAKWDPACPVQPLRVVFYECGIRRMYSAAFLVDDSEKIYLGYVPTDWLLNFPADEALYFLFGQMGIKSVLAN